MAEGGPFVSSCAIVDQNIGVFENFWKQSFALTGGSCTSRRTVQGKYLGFSQVTWSFFLLRFCSSSFLVCWNWSFMVEGENIWNIKFNNRNYQLNCLEKVGFFEGSCLFNSMRLSEQLPQFKRQKQQSLSLCRFSI